MADELKHQNDDFQISGESNDIISGLPVSILHHILSFLPFKDVVSTMILSKRWKLLWTGVSCLDFDQSLHFDATRNDSAIMHSRFINFVDKVLLLRDGSNIKKFRLWFLCNYLSSEADVESWFSAVVNHNVEDLETFIFAKRPFSLSCSTIFGCQSLRFLRLSICCTLQLPSHISLPSLEVLDLCFFTFPDAKSLEKLFSCCPILKKLSLSGCEWNHINNITISIPTLRTLVMCEHRPLRDVRCDNHIACYITIEAPALSSFMYRGDFIDQFRLSKLSSSVRAYIDGRAPNTDIKKKARLVNLLNALENMSFLKISSRTVEPLFWEDIVSNHLPVFHHLEHLQLWMRLKNRVVRGLVKLLYCLPKLSIIEFCQDMDSSKTVCDVQIPSIHVPNGFLPSLKKLALHDFRGGTCELFVLTSFLENVVSLQSINIFQCQDSIINPEMQQMWRDEVENLSTRFKHCEIIVR